MTHRVYAVAFVRSAREEMEELDSTLVKRIFPKIKALEIEPRPRGCRKLKGEKKLWRIRVGDYRVGFVFEDGAVTFVRYLDRKEIYRYFP